MSINIKHKILRRFKRYYILIKSKKGKTRQNRYFPFNIIILIAIIVFIIRLFFLDIMQVKGHSMDPTLETGQIIFINRFSYGIILPFIDKYILRWDKPKSGDIVVFYNPNNHSLNVKRCIASEYDNLYYKEGLLFIDDSNEPFKIGYSIQFNGVSEVPEGHILVLGDNLENSIDSRLFGFVKIDDIIGDVLFY